MLNMEDVPFLNMDDDIDKVNDENLGAAADMFFDQGDMMMELE